MDQLISIPWKSREFTLKKVLSAGLYANSFRREKE